MYLIALVAFIFYVVFLSGNSFTPGGNNIMNEAKQMRESLNENISKLIPLDEESLPVLSSTITEKKGGGTFNGPEKGIFISIYNEPMIAYAYKKYWNNNAALLFARTSKHEYVYFKKGNDVEITIDNTYSAILKEDGSLYGGQSKKIIGRIKPKTSGCIIVVNEREVGHLQPNPLDPKINNRAFDLLFDMTPEEEGVFIAMTIWKLINP